MGRETVYSIISSARAINICGTPKLSDFVVLGLGRELIKHAAITLLTRAE
jgi:hypothetical protein